MKLQAILEIGCYDGICTFYQYFVDISICLYVLCLYVYMSIWELKENRKNYTVDWLIAMKAHPYICGTRKCDLCLCEKLMIARANSASLLNKRDELVSKCRHE